MAATRGDKMKRDPWKMTLSVVAGLIVLACGGGAVTDKAADTTVAAVPGAPAAPVTSAAAKTPATKAGFGDVAITKCALSDNEFIGPEATVKVTNNSSKPSNYIVQVAFVSKDGATQLDTGTVLVSGLAPGQSSEEQASSLKSGAREQAAAGFECKVLDVTRSAA